VGIVTHYESFFRELAQKGCALKFLMVTPNFFTDHKFPGSWTGGQGMKEHLLQTAKDLGSITQISARQLEYVSQDGQKTEIRFLSLPPPFSLLLIDPDKTYGEVQVELYTYNPNVSNRPHFILTQESNKHWYDFFVREFDLAWNEASPDEKQNT